MSRIPECQIQRCLKLTLQDPVKLLGKKIDQNSILKESFCSKMNEGPKYYKEKCKRL